MEKISKKNCILVKLYIIISLFNYLSKVVKKLFAEKLWQFCGAKEKLYIRQIKKNQQQLVNDITILMIYKVHKTWGKKLITSILLINMKKVFVYILQVKLVEKMSDLGIDHIW